MNLTKKKSSLRLFASRGKFPSVAGPVIIGITIVILWPFAAVAGKLHDAAKNGDLAAVKALVEGKADVNAKDDQDATPIIWASMNGKLEVVQYLVSKQADVNASSGGITALTIAAQYGENDIVAFLLQSGADVNGKSQKAEESPLSQACMNGHKDTVQLLLSKGANAKANASSGNTLLHYAVRKENNEALVELLIKNGVDVNAKNILSGETPLIIAASRGFKSIAQALIKGGADVNIEKPTLPRSALFVAAWNRYLDERRYNETIDLLLQQGARDKWLSSVPGFDAHNFSGLVLKMGDDGRVLSGSLPFFLGKDHAGRPWKPRKQSDLSDSGTSFFSWEDAASKSSLTVIVIDDDNKKQTLGILFPPSFVGAEGVIYRDGITSIAKDGPFADLHVVWEKKPAQGTVILERKNSSTPISLNEKGVGEFVLKKATSFEPLSVVFKDDAGNTSIVNIDCVYRGATPGSFIYEVHKE
ncbi:MAG: ankyrin repeat domain-containing protein [Verrucomicrobiota bacterium]